MKKLRYPFLLFVVLLAVFYYWDQISPQSNPNSAPPVMVDIPLAAPQQFGCGRHSIFAELQFESKAQAPLAYLQGKNKAEALARLQILYLMGAQVSSSPNSRYTPDLQAVKITIREQKVVANPEGINDFEFNEMPIHIKDLAVITAENATLPAHAPFLSIRYQAKIPLVSCSNRLLPDTTPVVLPLDPISIFWKVRSVKNTLKNMSSPVSANNLCVNAPFAKLNKPAMLWYIWSPFASVSNSGLPASGYDCQKALRAGKDFINSTGKLTTVEDKTEPFAWDEPNREETMLHASFFFGVQTPELLTKNLLLQTQEALKNKDTFYGKLKSWVQGLRKKNTFADFGQSVFLQFSSAISESVDIESTSYKLHEYGLTYKIRGRLKQSKREVEINTYYGITNLYDITRAPFYAKSVIDAIATDDLIVYSGSSGLGEDFKISTLQRVAGTNYDATYFRQRKLQIYAAFCPYSYAYFGQDFFDMRGPSVSTDFFLSHTDSTSPWAGPVLLLLFDSALAHKTSVPIEEGRLIAPLVVERNSP